jgi:hypothetical protein
LFRDLRKNRIFAEAQKKIYWQQMREGKIELA